MQMAEAFHLWTVDDSLDVMILSSLLIFLENQLPDFSHPFDRQRTSIVGSFPSVYTEVFSMAAVSKTFSPSDRKISVISV